VLPDLIAAFPDPNNAQNLDSSIWFQQNGAPPHYGVNVRRFLDNQFERRWIGRRGPMEWPPRSPDLTPLDFFFEFFCGLIADLEKMVIKKIVHHDEFYYWLKLMYLFLLHTVYTFILTKTFV
jgi:hypothetical protein